MAGRALSAAQLQHNRDIAKKGGQATAAKYGGYHFAHAARSAKAHGTYVAPPVRAPFASLKAKQAAARLNRGASSGPATNTAAQTFSKSLTLSHARAVGGSKASSKSTSALPRSAFTTKRATVRRRPAVR